MLASKQFFIVLPGLLLACIMFFATTNNGYSGVSLGCCISPPNGTTDCIGCDGIDCSININLCESPNLFTGLGTCTDDGGGAECISGAGTGCCMNGQGNCLDQSISIEECAIGNQGLAWFPGDDCSSVPQCQNDTVSSVPALSQWTLLSIAMLLAVVGFLVLKRRRHAS